MKKLSALIPLILLLWACGDDYTPKPHGYPRFDFPEKKYYSYECDTCPYSFLLPAYAEVRADSGDMTAPCWVNIFYKPFNATLHVSYKKMDNISQLTGIEKQSYELAFKHSIRAEDIREIPVENRYGSSGIFYEIDGNTATALQFYMHDSSTNYLRGALYFNSKTQVDSVLPVLKFIRQDLDTMVQSLRWKNK